MDTSMSAKIRAQVEEEQQAKARELHIAELLGRPSHGKSRLQAHLGQRDKEISARRSKAKAARRAKRGKR